MPRELITVQIGQCGLQVGTKFWDLALREHAAYNRSGTFDDSLSSFFRNVDTRFNPPLELPMLDEKTKKYHPIATLKARAVLVDMEEGVLNELARSPLGELFDDRQLIKDVSGSGNNFAHGHFVYGPQYSASILEAVRHIAETCDSLQAFFLIHSLGGGTGSGLGTYILGELADTYPDIYRFVTGVFPSDQDDVITSPYNSVLSLSQLIQHADCVLPIHNQALIDICTRMDSTKGASGSSASASAAAASSSSSSALNVVQPSLLDPASSSSSSSSSSYAKRKLQKSKAFDDMNTLAAQLLTSLTCSMRFEGELNVDLNEITMNLVPYPRLHFLLPSLAPLNSMHGAKYAQSVASASAGFSSLSSSSSSASSFDPRMPSSSSSISSATSKSVDSMFTSLFHPSSHLVSTNPKHTGVYLACGIFGRGDVSVSDLNRNIARMKKEIHMIHWNEDGFKIGLCRVPPVGLKHSLLSLSNSSCIADVLSNMYDRCHKLYARKAHFHHYEEYMEEENMTRALQLCNDVIQDYANLERRDIERREDEEERRARGEKPKKEVQRMKPL